MNKKLPLRKIFIALTLFSSFISKAQHVGADVFMQGDYVEIGVGNGGWYGSDEAAPTGYHGRTPGPDLGFVSDPDKDGWTVGVPNYCGDYFVPGVPQEGWDLQVGSLWGKAWLSSGLTGGITGNNVSHTATATEIRGVWEGEFAGLAIRQTTILKKTKLYFLIKVTMKNTTTADITDIYYDRTLDPDNVSTMGPTGTVPGIVTSSSSTTVNTIEFKRPNPKSKSLVSAIGLLTVVKPTSPDTVDYPVYLGIGSKDCRAQPYILSSGLMPGTLDSPSRLFKNIINNLPGDHLFDSGQTNTTDAGTGLVFNIERLKPGDSTSFFMAYVLSTADLDSAFADMAPVWQFEGRQYESGDTIKLCRDREAADEIKDLNIGGGEDYSWTWEARKGLKNLTGTENQILMTNNPMTYVVRPSETFGCMDSMVITIIPYINPDPPAVVSPLSYCRYNSAEPLKGTPMTGAKMLYYSTITGGTGAASLIPSTATPGTFTYYASQINGICESGRTPITIIVYPIPKIEDITLFSPTFCGGTDGWIKFKVDNPGETYTVYFDKNGEAQPERTLTADADGIITIGSLGRGAYTAIYIKNSFGCVSNTYFGPVELKGPVAVTPIITNNGPICAGDTARLNTTPKDSTTYKWRGPDGFTADGPNVRFLATKASDGIYTLVTTKNLCVSDPVTTKLVIFPDPTNPNLPDQSLCEGADLIADVFAEENTDYIWSSENGFFLAEATMRRRNVTLDFAGMYILSASNERGCKMSDTIMVNIDPLVTLRLSADTSICSGDSISLFANTNTNAVIWSPSKGMNDTASKTPKISPAETTTYTVLAQSDHNTCPDTSAKVTVTVIPTPQVTGYDTLVRMNIPYTLVPTYDQKITKWKWMPADSLSCDNCPNPEFNSNKPITYIVYGSDLSGCTGHDTVTVRVFCDGANITMPNAFTPNGDGNNDKFTVRGTGFSVKSFSIYNRLGQLVFSKENFNPNDDNYGWDGTFAGQQISDASGFVYMLEAICINSTNEPILIKGTVLMIK